MYGKIKEFTVQELKALFSNDSVNYIDTVLLFGSRASCTAKLQSDYDFAVSVTQDLDTLWGIDAKLWKDIGELLNLADTDYDVVNLLKADNFLKKSIKENYIVLKGDGRAAERLLDTDN
ncbi:MAG TPA: nucleotidyltransferase domain-containing protein [Desulfobacteraceae bacterium]|nr:nucleotidyltransferase domain-containing protein [Desulfobacteraceae bacterium]